MPNCKCFRTKCGQNTKILYIRISSLFFCMNLHILLVLCWYQIFNSFQAFNTTMPVYMTKKWLKYREMKIDPLLLIRQEGESNHISRGSVTPENYFLCICVVWCWTHLPLHRKRSANTLLGVLPLCARQRSHISQLQPEAAEGEEGAGMKGMKGLTVKRGRTSLTMKERWKEGRV